MSGRRYTGARTIFEQKHVYQSQLYDIPQPNKKLQFQIKLRETIQLQPDERRSKFLEVLYRLEVLGSKDIILKHLPKNGVGTNWVFKNSGTEPELKLRKSIQLQPDERRAKFLEVLCRLRIFGFKDIIFKYLPKMGVLKYSGTEPKLKLRESVQQ